MQLAALASVGHQVSVVFIVQRGDVVHGVRPSDWHDPCFASTCRSVAAKGVVFRAFRVVCSTKGSLVTHEIPVDLKQYDVQPVADAWEAQRNHTGWLRTFDANGPLEDPATWKVVANGPFPHHKKSTTSSERRERSSTTAPDPKSGKKRSRYFAGRAAQIKNEKEEEEEHGDDDVACTPPSPLPTKDGTGIESRQSTPPATPSVRRRKRRRGRQAHPGLAQRLAVAAEADGGDDGALGAG